MEEEKKKILNRLRRIEGQVRGLHKMIEKDSDCSDILLQVAAVRAAINKVGAIIFTAHFQDCLDQAMETGDMENLKVTFVELMGKYLK